MVLTSCVGKQSKRGTKKLLTKADAAIKLFSLHVMLYRTFVQVQINTQRQQDFLFPPFLFHKAGFKAPKWDINSASGLK
jgi:hypothetical protein